MNYWGEGNHQQPEDGGFEVPAWLLGAIVYGAIGVILLIAIFWRVDIF